MVFEKGVYEAPKTTEDVIKKGMLPIPTPTYVAPTPTYDTLKAGVLPIPRDIVSEEVHTEIPSKFTSPYFWTGEPETRVIYEERVAREQFVSGGGLYGEVVVEQVGGVGGAIEDVVKGATENMGLLGIIGIGILLVVLFLVFR